MAFQKMKYKHMEILTVYLTMVMIVILLNMAGIISHDNLIKYEISLVGITLYLAITRILSYKNKHKEIINLSWFAFVLLCISFYYTSAMVGFFIFLVSVYTILSVMLIAYNEQNK